MGRRRGGRPGTLRELPLESVRLRETVPALLWSAADTDPERPLPLLIVHDGPEYAEYSSLVRLLDHLVDFGEVPELRAALVPPPGDRNESYSASARYANALAADLVPGILREAPSNRRAGPGRREPRRARRAARALPQPRARSAACSSSRAASSGGGSTGSEPASPASRGSRASSVRCTAGAVSRRASRRRSRAGSSRRTSTTTARSSARSSAAAGTSTRLAPRRAQLDVLARLAPSSPRRAAPARVDLNRREIELGPARLIAYGHWGRPVRRVPVRAGQALGLGGHRA